MEEILINILKICMVICFWLAVAVGFVGVVGTVIRKILFSKKKYETNDETYEKIMGEMFEKKMDPEIINERMKVLDLGAFYLGDTIYDKDGEEYIVTSASLHYTMSERARNDPPQWAYGVVSKKKIVPDDFPYFGMEIFVHEDKIGINYFKDKPKRNVAFVKRKKRF